MLNKEQVVAALNKFQNDYQIPQENILVFAGSALVLHGLRDFCSDIDLGLPTEECHRLEKLEGFTKTTPRVAGFLRMEIGDLDMGNNTYPAQWVGGFRVQTLESLLQLKLEMNRPKDQEDIKKLQAVLA